MSGIARDVWVSACTLITTLILGLSVFGSAAEGARSSREIVVNIPAFALTLYEDGIPIRTYPVGVGQSVMPSRLGETRIINNVHNPTYYPPNWWSRGLRPIPPGPDNPVGTRWLGLGFPGYGIHGTNNPASIGTAASAGCIRMHNADVEELSRLVGVGTPVRLVYETVEVWSDEQTGESFIRVFPDVYRWGTSTLEQVEIQLEEPDLWGRIDHAALSSLLQQANGQVMPLPLMELPVGVEFAAFSLDVSDDVRALAARTLNVAVDDVHHAPNLRLHASGLNRDPVAPHVARHDALHDPLHHQPNLSAAHAATTPAWTEPPPALPSGTAMIENLAHVVFPKAAVGLLDGTLARVAVAATVSHAGDVVRVELVQSSGFAVLDNHARKLAELGLRYKSFDDAYEIGVYVDYDATDPRDNRMTYHPGETIRPVGSAM